MATPEDTSIFGGEMDEQVFSNITKAKQRDHWFFTNDVEFSALKCPCVTEWQKIFRSGMSSHWSLQSWHNELDLGAENEVQLNF